MIKQMPISETRKNINAIASDLSLEDTISVTNRGEKVLAIIPWETYEAITETLEIFSDKKTMIDFQKGLKDIKEGKLVNLDDAIKELDIV